MFVISARSIDNVSISSLNYLHFASQQFLTFEMALFLSLVRYDFILDIHVEIRILNFAYYNSRGYFLWLHISLWENIEQCTFLINYTKRQDMGTHIHSENYPALICQATYNEFNYSPRRL